MSLIYSPSSPSPCVLRLFKAASGTAMVQTCPPLSRRGDPRSRRRERRRAAACS
jgi:hypothetical protein